MLRTSRALRCPTLPYASVRREGKLADKSFFRFFRFPERFEFFRQAFALDTFGVFGVQPEYVLGVQV